MAPNHSGTVLAPLPVPALNVAPSSARNNTAQNGRLRSRALPTLLAASTSAIVYGRCARPWQLTWGATPGEVSRPLAGDELVPRLMGRHSARRIIPELQNLAPGEVVPMSPNGKKGIPVLSMDPPTSMVWGTSGSTWIWQLDANPDGSS